MMVDPLWFMLESGWNREIGAWWVRRWAYDFCLQLESRESPQAWTETIAATRRDLDATFLGQAADPATAASVWFAVDLVETVNLVPEHRSAGPGYLIQVALTVDELEAWQGRWPPPAPSTPADPGLTSGPADPEVPLHGMLPLRDLPEAWVDTRLIRGQLEVLRDLYRIVHKRAEQAITKAVRESRDLAEWREAMALQIITRASQNILPVTRSGMGWAGADEIDPRARLLFEDGELESLRKGEAYAEEQFAHLGTALDKGCHEQAYIDELAVKVRESTDDPLETRRALRAGRARYRVPPFLVRELDQHLRARGAPPS
jgi:hypothetical protein